MNEPVPEIKHDLGNFRPMEAARLHALLLEESPSDADKVESCLISCGFGLEMRRVASRQDYLDAINAGGFEIILANHALPDVDGLTALRIAKDRYPDVPFIFVSGEAGEEFANDARKHGAIDCVLKQNLPRLPVVVDRALAHAARQENEVRLRLAVSAPGLGTWDYTPDQDEVVWRIGGAEERRTTYEGFMAGVHPIDRARIETALRAAMTDASIGVFTTEYRLRPRDGLTRWITTHGQCFFRGGKCFRFVGVLQDITERKTAEATLRRQNRLLAREVRERTRERDRIWSLSRDLMIVCDVATRVIAVNPAWTRLLGWTETELLGKPAIELVHPEERDTLRLNPEGGNDNTTDDNTTRVECRISRKDGGYRWVNWTAVSQDALIYAIGRDVTEAKATTEEVAAANRQLVRQIEERERVEITLRQMQRLEAVGQLTAGVAHDFNNLLSVVLGNIALLHREMNGMEPRLIRRLDQMNKAAERGATLTAQLLAFSRRQRLEPKPIDLNDTVLGMRDLLQSTMGGSVRVRTGLASKLWFALVDPTQIELIILNLAINARDAMQGGGDLLVATSNTTLSSPSQTEEPPPGEYVMLSISDTGYGMSDEVRQRAFEPFFTTKQVGKGSGLGLAQVFGFVKQSGGGIRIETEVGKGTSIHVFLPRAQPLTERTAEASDVPANKTPAAHETLILLVDDDGAVREITAKMLRNLGYDVVEAGSGGAALDLLAREPRISLSILDYAMPGMTGVEVAQEVHKRRPGLPIVFITGYVDLTALKEVGEDRILQKPFREADLADKIGRSLRIAYG